MRNSIAKGIAAILVAGVLAAGVCCTGFASRGDDGKWFGNGNISTWHWNDKTDDKTPDDKPDDITGERDLVNVIEESGVALCAAVIPVSDYAANGISPQAENAYTLTARISPENADNKAVDWSVSWVNGSSTWAAGKTVTDYVTVTPTNDGALTATVTCVQAFGEQIHVRCTSRDNREAYAICTVDFAKKIIDVRCNDKGADLVDFSLLDEGHTFDNAFHYDFVLNPVYSAYTVDDMDKSAFEWGVEGCDYAHSGSMNFEEFIRSVSGYSVAHLKRAYTVSDMSDSTFTVELVTGIYMFRYWDDQYYNKAYYSSQLLDKLDKLCTTARSLCESVPNYYLFFKATGIYSSVSFEIPIYCAPSGFIVPVSDVNMGDSGIIF